MTNVYRIECYWCAEVVSHLGAAARHKCRTAPRGTPASWIITKPGGKAR